MIFNLIPIPPLDGSKVMFAFMDRRDRVPGPALPRAVRLHHPAGVLFFPPGNSIGGRIIIPILDALYALLVGS